MFGTPCHLHLCMLNKRESRILEMIYNAMMLQTWLSVIVFTRIAFQAEARLS